MVTKVRLTEQAEAADRLRKWLKPGDTVFTILRHVSRSGMMRSIQVVTFEMGEPAWLGYNVALAIGAPYDREREGVRMNGCGMDMGFETVYQLGAALWPKGFKCSGARCNSNEHRNYRLSLPCPSPDCGWGFRQQFVTPPSPLPEPCATCDSQGSIANPEPNPRGRGVLHRDGGYALVQRWM